MCADRRRSPARRTVARRRVGRRCPAPGPPAPVVQGGGLGRGARRHRHGPAPGALGLPVGGRQDPDGPWPSRTLSGAGPARMLLGMDVTERESLLARYEEGPAVVEAAVAAVTAAGTDAFDRRPAPGEWTAREVVHHLADSEMTSAIRLRRLLAEDDPVIVGYDEAEFARRLHYDRPLDASLDLLRAARRTTADILRRLDEADWSR